MEWMPTAWQAQPGNASEHAAAAPQLTRVGQQAPVAAHGRLRRAWRTCRCGCWVSSTIRGRHRSITSAAWRRCCVLLRVIHAQARHARDQHVLLCVGGSAAAAAALRAAVVTTRAARVTGAVGRCAAAV
jgi:hypothetical protein